MVNSISPQQVNTLGDQALILDVRTDTEHQAERLACPHIHIPLDQLDARNFITSQNLKQGTTLYLLCLGGVRATKAAEQFIKAGHEAVAVIENGLNGCKTCGVPLARSARPSMSLERQVRITAGLFAAVGAALALWMNPWFGLVPLAVGSGLVLAGLTNSCAMGVLLAKAPWNRGCPGEKV